MNRDYTLVYRVDTSQAGPAFQAIRTDLHHIRDDLDEIARHASNTHNAMLGLGAGANQTMGDLGGSSATTKKAFLGLSGQVIATAAAFKGFELGIELVGKIGEQINSAREHMKELAEEAMKTRSSMRELANLKGDDGPNDAVTADTIAFGMGAGMVPKEATKFMEQFLGSNPAGLQKGNVGGGKKEGETQAEYEKRVEPISDAIALEGARFGQRLSLEPQTAGDLAGVLPMFSKLNSGEEAAQKMGRIAYGLNEGRGKIEGLMRNFINVSSSLVDAEGEGVVKNDEELAVLYGVMSTAHGNPREAGTYLKKGARELRQFKGQQGHSLHDMGINADDDHLSAVRKLAVRLEADKAKGIIPDQSLRAMGFNDESGIQALIEASSKLKEVDVRLAKQKLITGKDVQKQNDNFFKRDYAGVKLQLDAEKAGKDWLTGRGQEPWQLARAAASMRMRDNGELADGEARFVDMIWDAGGILPWMGVPKAMEKRINENAYQHLQTEAKNIGGQVYNDFRDETEIFHDFNGVERSVADKHSFGKAEAPLFNKLVPKILDAGGNPFQAGGTREKVKKIAEAHRQRENQEKANPGGPPSFKVLEVLDGDTIKVHMDGKAQTVRMVGVDTPETVHPTKGVQPGGKKASDYTKKQLTGQRVFLKDNAVGDKVDKYGRRLSYVHREDGSDFNKELIDKGLGKAYTHFPFDRSKEYIDAEAKAKAAGKIPGKDVTQNDMNTTNDLLRQLLGATHEQTGKLDMIGQTDGGGLPTFGGFGPKRA